LPVDLVDERLTTREARDRLASEGRAGDDDHPVAAQIILEGWLNQQKTSA
jgi:RNase H-fold protein (predicted Holliday junction resolvase)